jgi:hypothetical protein
MNHWAGKVVVTVQEGLMKSRDERVALMNEVLGAIRMIKARYIIHISPLELTALLVHGMGTKL